MSVRADIIVFLRDRGWTYGGTVEDYIRESSHKASNASRRLRELENEGRLEARYVQNPNGGGRVVQYRYKREEAPVEPPSPVTTPHTHTNLSTLF